MVAMIDGPMVRRLIENNEEFTKFVEEKFKMKNQKIEEKDGFVAVDLEKYKVELRGMMLAVAQGIGNTPVNVMVEEGSFLSKVYEFEISRIQMEKQEEEKKTMKIEEEKEKGKFNLNNIINGNNERVKIVTRNNKSLKKKSSFNLSSFCACSGKQFVDNS
ncbi:hypothetical protein RND81_04G024200 [Saponaria officinalis]|uniref:Uncharacterized protein n=1 Tax=Saponaria officinalis TaxID=3572 RepID=A0AAW1LJT8_SAPOF